MLLQERLGLLQPALRQEARGQSSGDLGADAEVHHLEHGIHGATHALLRRGEVSRPGRAARPPRPAPRPRSDDPRSPCRAGSSPWTVARASSQLASLGRQRGRPPPLLWPTDVSRPARDKGPPHAARTRRAAAKSPSTQKRVHARDASGLSELRVPAPLLRQHPRAADVDAEEPWGRHRVERSSPSRRLPQEAAQPSPALSPSFR